MQLARLAVDIGGTFTDVALERGGARWTAKVLTTPAAPERAVLEGTLTVLAQAGVSPGRRLGGDSWHHPGHQRSYRTQGRAHRADHHRGLSRRAGDGQ